MENWAEREIDLAIRNAYNANDPEGNRYYAECCKSALKAYNSLIADGHSGASIIVTKNILNRLIDNKSFTPITDDCEYWVRENLLDEADCICYRSTRMSSLFKYVYEDGSEKFTDVDRVKARYINGPGTSFYNGTATRIIDEMFPIVLPYWPGDGFVMYCEDFLFNPVNGDFDTVGYLYATRSGKPVRINRFFKEDETTHKLVEITKNEYEDRKSISKNRKETK